MAGRVVEAVYVANIDDLKVKMAQAAAVSDKAGAALGDAFVRGSERAGVAVKGLTERIGQLDVAGASSFSKFGNAISSVESKGKSLSATIASIGKGVAIGGLAAFAAAAYEGVKGAAALQQQMTMLHTQAGASTTEVKNMTAAVLGMAGSVGTKPEALATAIYHIESAGYRGTQALNMLKVAAEGAKVGNADLTDTAQALAATIYSNIPGAQNLQQAMGALNATVGAGDMTMQQLNEAFQGPMLATVKGYGLSIKDVGASLADFGDLNIRGADAATQLRMAVQYMAKPAATAGPMLAALGLNTRSFAQALANGGLMPALDLLKQKLVAANVPANQYAQVISDLFTKKGSAGVEILINSLSRLQSKYGDIAKGEGSFGADWTATTKNLSFMWSQVEAGASAFADKLGGALIPKLISLGQYVARNKGTFEDLAKVLTGVLGAAVVWWAGTAAVGFVKSIASMVLAVESFILKSAAAKLAVVEDATAMDTAYLDMGVEAKLASSTVIAANEAAGASFTAMLGPIGAVLLAMEGIDQIGKRIGPSSGIGGSSAASVQANYNQQIAAAKGNAAQIAKINVEARTANANVAKTGLFAGDQIKIDSLSQAVAAGMTGGRSASNAGYAPVPTGPTPTGGRPSSNTPPGAINPAVDNALGGGTTPKTPSTAMTAAQLALDIAGIHGNEQLKLATSKAAGGSLEKLQTLLTAVHKAGFNRLIDALTSSDNVSLQKMGATLQTTFATALEKLYQLPALATYAKANALELGAQQTAGNTTASANAGQAQVTGAGLTSQQAVDNLNAAATSMNDAAKLQSDAAAAEVLAIQAQTTALQDSTNAQVAAITDQTQVQVDTLGERGLYGLAMTAQLAKVALDQQKATDDASIAAAQAHLDQVTASTNAASSAAQLRVDAVQQQADAAEAAATSKLDSDAVTNAVDVAKAQATADAAATTAAVNNAAAQAHVDAVQFGSQAQTTAAAAAQKLVNAQSDSLTANANKLLQGVTNSANLSNANDQAASAQATAYWTQQLATTNQMLTSAQNAANIQQALASQSLGAIQNQSAITEARLTSILSVDNELVSTQYAGGYVVNLYANPGDGPAEYANAIGWELRTSRPSSGVAS